MTVRRVALGDLGRFVGGGTPSRKVPEYFSGQIPWATVKDFKSDRISSTLEHLSEAGLKNSSSRLVPKGSLLIVSRMGLGKAAIAEVDVAINQDIKAFIPNGDHDIEFLLWCLKALAPEIERRGAGATVKGVTLQDISSLPIPLPPIEEQRRIVDILNRAASIERLKARASAHLRDFIPALFLKMFGDPIENPMGWPTSALGDLLQMAQYGSSKKADATDDAIPVLRMGNVSYDGYLDCSDLKYVELPDAELDKYLLAKGDLLFNRTNSKELVGKTGMWDGRFTAIAASYFIRLRVDAALADPTYIWAFMNTASMKGQLFDMARGAIGQANINAKELQAIIVPVPPLETQRAFAKLVEAAAARSRLSETASRLAADLSRSLLDKLLGVHGRQPTDQGEHMADAIPR
ncbi:restriction endonuclease subunit S [Roseibacterium sp. SDUM158016]|uniref:restriction endonuclease subunit S n=1 Tax=Roseicyclus sediminis TaxID=2980997 RepID=UPI0021CE5F7B|nr:restriction endonuclease subunit S [Roseibacterium sp. SDUM158016]MCU4652253.1 restriction endonuclease subunit S [Roseibacterium sp. SDUM158016]